MNWKTFGARFDDYGRSTLENATIKRRAYGKRKIGTRDLRLGVREDWGLRN